MKQNEWLGCKKKLSDLDKITLTVGVETTCEVYKELEEYSLVPRAFDDFHYVESFSTTFGGKLRTLKAINLRNEQVPAVDAMMSFAIIFPLELIFPEAVISPVTVTSSVNDTPVEFPPVD